MTSRPTSGGGPAERAERREKSMDDTYDMDAQVNYEGLKFSRGARPSSRTERAAVTGA